jgi:hypothetical protein
MKEITKIESSTDTYKINKNLKLNTVNEGEPTDNVLVHGSDNEVKSIPRSEFLGGSQTLEETLLYGDSATDQSIKLRSSSDEISSEIRSSGMFINGGSSKQNGFISNRKMQMSNSSNGGLKLVEISPEHIGFTNDFSGQIKVKPIETVTENLEQLLQNKSGTIALLSDITGGSQNLDQTLTNGNATDKSIIIKDAVITNIVSQNGISTQTTDFLKTATYNNEGFYISDTSNNQRAAYEHEAFVVGEPDNQHISLMTKNIISILNNTTSPSTRAEIKEDRIILNNPENELVIGIYEIFKSEQFTNSVLRLRFNTDNMGDFKQILPCKDGIIANIDDILARTVENATTRALTSANLDAAYPTATLGFEVIAASIAGGGLIYEKTSTGWIQYAATKVP